MFLVILNEQNKKFNNPYYIFFKKEGFNAEARGLILV